MLQYNLSLCGLISFVFKNNERYLNLLNFKKRLIIRFDTFSQRIRHSEYGYTPLGYAVKVDEEKLNKLVEYDYSLYNKYLLIL